MTQTRVIGRNAVVRVGAEIASKAISVVLFAAMARTLGQADFGAFIFALSLSSLLISFAGPGTNDILTREVSRDRATLPRIFWNAMTVKSALGVAAVIVGGVVPVIGGYPADVGLAVPLLTLALLVDTISKTLQATFIAYDEQRPVAKALLLQRTATTVIGLGVLAAGGELVAITLVFVIGGLVAPLYLFPTLIRLTGWIPLRFSAREAWRLYIVAFPLGLSAVLTTVLVRVDAVLLSWFKPQAVVGIYGAAYRVLDSTMFIPWTFASTLMPTYSRGGEGLTAAVQGGYKVMLAVLAPISLTLALFAEPIMRIVFGTEYTDGATALRLLSGTITLFGLSYLAQTALIARDRQKVIPWLTAGTAIENIALNLALIPAYSLNGAAFATTFAELSRCIVALALMRRLTERISLTRVAVGPLAGGLAMVGVWALNAPALVGLILAPLAYAATLYVVESKLYPADVTRFKELLRRPEPRPAATGMGPS